jgi:hypothetical protein
MRVKITDRIKISPPKKGSEGQNRRLVNSGKISGAMTDD